ncbi:hypothetical protein Tco_1314864 [Tanacetum coccineum]
MSQSKKIWLEDSTLAVHEGQPIEGISIPRDERLSRCRRRSNMKRKDLWTGNSPLYLRYNRLFRLDRDKDCLIKDCFIDNVWTWNWSRSFMGARNAAHLCDLITEITPF